VCTARIDSSTGYQPYDFDSAKEQPEVLEVVVDEDYPSAETAHAVTAAVLASIQNWMAVPQVEQNRLTVVTRRAVLIAGDDRVDPVSAAVWGLVRSAQNENPGRLALVDTDGSTIFVHGAADAEPVVAIRRGQLQVPRIQRADPTHTPASQIDSESTVLIVGGTGALGAHVARHMAATGLTRNMVLASRTGQSAPGAQQLLEELRQMNVNATIAQCDPSKRDELKELIDSIPPEAALTMVLNAAGHVADAPADTLTKEQLETVLRSKVDITCNLDALTTHLDLKAFVMFSSAAAVLGSPGQANYAAANAFLDAFAQHRQSRGLPGLSVAWGIWDQTTGGMSGRLPQADALRIQRNGLLQLPRETALALFDSALASKEPVVIAAAFNAASIVRWSDTPSLFARFVRHEYFRRPSTDASKLLEKLSRLDHRRRRDLVLTEVQSIAADILGHADRFAIGPDTPFKDLGFDSLTTVEFRNRLQTSLGQRLPVSTVFDYPTPLRVAEHIIAVLTDRHPDKFARPAHHAPQKDPTTAERGHNRQAATGEDIPIEMIENMDVESLVELARRG
jgi:NAD(P)-dependent dehydrogenase (short-subunit alcohol dehydrogenase family)/acyl carrier protein